MLGENNIFNLPVAGCRKYRSVDTNNLATYDTLEFCIYDWCAMMRKYRYKYKNLTIRSIVERFHNPKKHDVETYIDYCCRYTRLKPDTRLVLAIQYARLAVAMARLETKTRIREGIVTDVIWRYNVPIINVKMDEKKLNIIINRTTYEY